MDVTTWTGFVALLLEAQRKMDGACWRRIRDQAATDRTNLEPLVAELLAAMEPRGR